MDIRRLPPQRLSASVTLDIAQYQLVQTLLTIIIQQSTSGLHSTSELYYSRCLSFPAREPIPDRPPERLRSTLLTKQLMIIIGNGIVNIFRQFLLIIIYLSDYWD